MKYSHPSLQTRVALENANESYLLGSPFWGGVPWALVGLPGPFLPPAQMATKDTGSPGKYECILSLVITLWGGPPRAFVGPAGPLWPPPNW